MIETESRVFGIRASDGPEEKPPRTQVSPQSPYDDEWRRVNCAPSCSCPCVRPTLKADRSRYQRAARAGTWLRVQRGLYVPAEEWRGLTAVQQARTVVRALASDHSDWVFGLFSAAAMYGLEIGRDCVLPIHVFRSSTCHTKSTAGVTRHVIQSRDFVTVEGVRVTPPAQTVVDCLLQLPFPRALAVADSALRVLDVTKDELWAELSGRMDGHGWRTARDSIAYADPRSENGGESVARAVMIEQGFPMPELQKEVDDPIDMSRKYYVDFFWRLANGVVVAAELDGRDKYVNPEMTGGRDMVDTFADERQRESRLTAKGIRVFRFRYRDLSDVGKFVQALEAYGVPRGPARQIGR